MDRGAPVVVATLKNAQGGDQAIDLSQRLLSFEFEDHDLKADKAVFVLDNRDLALLDDQVWKAGREISVAWGYPGSLHNPQSVIIKKVRGSLQLRVEGFAKSILMHREQRTKAFQNMRRSDAVRAVAIENGFASDQQFIEDTIKVYEVISQVAETDAAFLQRQAKRAGFRFWVDADGLHWKKAPYESAPTHELIYYTDPGRGTIIGFDLESDLFLAPGEVKVKGQDAATKQGFTAKGSDGSTQRTELAGEIEIVHPEAGTTLVLKNNATASIRHTAAQDEAEAQREADARFDEASRKRLRLRLDIVGDPTLTAKRVIEVKGLGDYCSGKFYVYMVKHRIGTGYVQQVFLKRGTVGRTADGKETEAAQNRNALARPGELMENVHEQSGVTTYRRR